jgi:predicted SnoaL-like aldol condensation-catalyzing enzyme
MKKIAITLTLAALTALSLPAQKVVGAESAADKQTLEIAKKEFKDMLQYGHVEVADQAMAPTYIQHNPNVPGTRDGFKAFFGPRAKPEPIQDSWKRPPTLIIVSGPYVLFMTDQQAKDPANPDKTYTRDHFDIVRIDNNLIQEHWDEAKKNPPANNQGKKQ